MRGLITAAGLSLLIAVAVASLAPSSGAQGYCPPGLTCVSIGPGRQQTPEEKAEQARRDAAERARAAEFKRKVDAKVATMGEHRRAEAENSVRMQDAAAAARPKFPTPVSAPGSQNCRPTKTVWSDGGESGKSMAEARARTDAARARTCRDGKVCGETSCTEKKPFSQKLGKTELYAPGSFSCGFKVTHERTVCDTRVTSQ